MLVRSEIEKLHTICHYLRRTAMINNQPQTLIFDIKHKSYKYHDGEEKLSQQVVFGFLPKTLGPPSEPKTIVHTPITFKKNTITFYPDGIISSGTVYLIDTTKQYMYAFSSPIAQISYLRLYRYDGTWKNLL